MILSASELTTLRQHPHGTKLWLSIFQPTTLLAARVTGSVAVGDRNVRLYGISQGSVGAAFSGSTAMIGSAPGTDDVARIRIRTSSGSVIGVAENSIPWQVGQYVTVINQIDINSIYPRIIQNPSNPEDVIFYKDYDIPYSNQNSIMGSLVCMGDHFAGFLENGSGNVYYSATGTVNVNGASNTYLWEFEGGTPTGSTAHTPGNVAYSSPGHYKTKLTVTSSEGAVDVSHRYISWYNRPESGASNPILNWSLQDVSGSRSEGGYTFTVVVRENVNTVQPNAIVVIFADEFYGTTDGSLGGKPNRSKIKFVGYIIEDSISYNYQTSEVTFRVGSVSEIMKLSDGFSVSVESKTNPTTWFEIQDMSVLKAIYHYLKWHSTVNLVSDVQYTGDDRKVQYFDADRTSLYDAVYSLVSTGLLGNVVSDRCSKLWVEIDPRGLENPLSYPTAMSILKQDWLDSPSITEKRSHKTSFIELGGIAYSGSYTGTFSAHLSNAPSETPLYRGAHRDEKGLILLGQNQLNSIAGHLLAMENSKFPEIEFGLNGNYSNLDIAPIEFVQPFIAPEDTYRNVRIQNEKYMIERMDWMYDAQSGVLRTGIGVAHVTTGSAGATIDIPDTPDDSGFSVPNFQVPPLPAFAIPSNLSSSTGTSCCDNIIGNFIPPTVYSTTQIKNGIIGFSLGENSLVNKKAIWEFASNMSMYDTPNAETVFLNTGTISYTLDIETVLTVTGRDEAFLAAQPAYEPDYWMGIAFPYAGGESILLTHRFANSTPVGTQINLVASFLSDDYIFTINPNRWKTPSTAYFYIRGDIGSVAMAVKFTNTKVSIRGTF